MPNKLTLPLLLLCAALLAACNLPLAVTPLPPPPPEETLPPLPPATADYPTPSPLAALDVTPTITPILLTATLTTPLTGTLTMPLTVTLTAPLTVTLPAPTAPAAVATLATVDPCSLLTKPEATAILGEDVQDPIIDGFACSYTDETSKSRLVSAYAVQGEQARNALAPHMVMLGTFGLQVDPATRDQLYALDREGANRQLLERLVELSQGNSAFSSRRVDGLGDLSYWAWKDTGHGVRQGFLITLRGDVVAGATLVTGDKVDENLAIDLTSLIMRQIFTRLPEQFILATPAP